MSFLYPACLATLVIIPLILLLVIVMRKNRATVWSAFVSSQHKTELVTQTSTTKFWISLACSLLGLLCMIIAASRPFAGKSVTREQIQSRNILIAMDTSLSMLCEDVQPNRLGSGVTFAVNLIHSLPDDHIGIMAYAGSPNVITSLSIDHPAIIEELAHLGPGSAHIPGSNLTEALYRGINTLKRAGKQANALVLITDGAETIDEIDEITQIAKEAYVQIFTVGVGTTAGGTIPINGQPHRDSQKKVVITKLQDTILRQLARDTSGVYTHINTQPEKAISEAIQSMNQYEKQGRETRIPKELYQWFLAPGIFLLILSALLNARFKSSLPALLIITFFITPSSSRAEETTWLKSISSDYLTRPAKIKAGYSALENKQYLEAFTNLTEARKGSKEAEHAKLSLAIGQCHYRLGQYQLAAQEFSQALTSNNSELQNIAQYNLANSLYKQQTIDIKVPADQELTQYLETLIRSNTLTNTKLDYMETGLKNAVTHYTDLLALDPQHNSATSNKNTALQVIQALQEARKTIAQEKAKQPQLQEEDQPKEATAPEENNQDNQDGNSEQESDQNNKQQGNQEKESNEPNTQGEQQDKTNSKGKPDQQEDQPKESSAKDPIDPSTKKTTPCHDPSDKGNKKTSEFSNKQEALEFLEKHSDTRKKPLTKRRHHNRPAIDW